LPQQQKKRLNNLRLLNLNIWTHQSDLTYNDDSVDNVKKSSHKKDNPKAHKDKGESDRTDGKKINDKPKVA
jgi:hypothetical protein